jgi:hypothetical protein
MRYSKPQKLWNYHEWCMRTNSTFITWNQFRDAYFLPENCAGHQQHEKVVVKYNKRDFINDGECEVLKLLQDK